MNQVATNPPSRMTKEELRQQADIAQKEADDAKAAVNLLEAENNRMLQELDLLRKRESGQAGNTTEDLAEDGERDPVTGKLLRPALSQEELDAQDEEIGATYDSMMDVPDAPIQPVQTQRLARVAPVSIRPSLETDERDTGLHGKIAQFTDTAAGEEPKLVEHARDVDVWAARKKAENIAFMKQMVTIHIQMVNDRQADKMFSIGVNGRQWSFERNKEYTVPRYVVEGLLRAKPMTYGNEEYTKANGERDVRWPIQQGCRYPFAIVVDTYPRWREWMMYTMQQPD